MALFWVLLSLFIGYLGRDRKFGFWGFFLGSILFSPVVTLLVLLLTWPKEEPFPPFGEPAVAGHKAK